MIFIYDKNTGEVKAFYQGDIPQLHNYGEEAAGWGEAQFPDDPEVLNNPHDYKVVVYNGLPITYQKKPELKLIIDKDQITGDGEDFAVLKAGIDGVHPLEVEKYKKATIRINDKIINLENGEEVEIASYGPSVIIQGDLNMFRGDMMRRRIIVGQKPKGIEQTIKVEKIEEMHEKIKELERKINEISRGEVVK